MRGGLSSETVVRGDHLTGLGAAQGQEGSFEAQALWAQREQPGAGEEQGEAPEARARREQPGAPEKQGEAPEARALWALQEQRGPAEEQGEAFQPRVGASAPVRVPVQ